MRAETTTDTLTPRELSLRQQMTPSEWRAFRSHCRLSRRSQSEASGGCAYGSDTDTDSDEVERAIHLLAGQDVPRSVTTTALSGEQTFVMTLLKQTELGQQRPVLTRVHNCIADLLDDDRFDAVDSLLREVPIQRLPPVVGLAFLMATANTTNEEVPFRAEFRKSLRSHYVAERGEDAARQTIDVVR